MLKISLSFRVASTTGRALLVRLFVRLSVCRSGNGDILWRFLHLSVHSRPEPAAAATAIARAPRPRRLPRPVTVTMESTGTMSEERVKRNEANHYQRQSVITVIIRVFTVSCSFSHCSPAACRLSLDLPGSNHGE